MTRATYEPDPIREQLLDAVERLFYARGIQAVGMDEIRANCGLSLKRIYQLYPSKEQLVVAFLRRRDVRWRGQLAAYVERTEQPDRRILAVFDWLHQWFSDPDFHGCAWINVYGELGATTPVVAAAVRGHKQAFRRYLSRVLVEGGYPRSLTTAIYLLAEGAMVTAAIDGNPKAGIDARAAMVALLGTAKHPG